MSTPIRASCAFTGTGTYIHTVQTAGVIKLFASLSDVNGFAGLTIIIQHNGSTIATSGAEGGVQLNSMGLNAAANCSIGDTLSCVISSSAGADSNPNAIKGTFTLSM